MRHALHVFLERLTRLLLVVGCLVGLIGVFGTAILVTLGIQAGNVRVSAIGLAAGFALVMFTVLSTTLLKTQQRIVAEWRTHARG